MKTETTTVEDGGELYIQDIMKLSHDAANKEHAFLVVLPGIDKFVGVSFRNERTADLLLCVPQVKFVTIHNTKYTYAPLTEFEDDYESLTVYAEVGKLVRRAIMRDVTWTQLLETIAQTVAEVHRP